MPSISPAIFRGWSWTFGLSRIEGGGTLSDPFANVPSSDDTVRRPLPVDGLRRTAAPIKAFPPAGPILLNGFEAIERPAHRTTLDDDIFGLKQQKAQPPSPLDFGLGGGSAGFQQERIGYRGDPAIDKAFDLAAVNPLVSAASPLLWLAGRLNESVEPDDIVEFRRRVGDEIRHFETAAMAKDVPERLVRVSRYALCAVIDDIILNTRWGGASGWASSSLVSALYNETWGGERVYDLLSQLSQQPDQNIDALELFAICLAIGFYGKYRVMEGGAGQLARLRQDLYRTIRRVRGPYERTLSAAWQSVAAPHRAPRSLAGPWMAALAVLALLVALWAFSSIMLRTRVEETASRIRTLVPTIPVLVERAGIPDIPEPRPPVKKTQMERISEALASEIAAHRVEVVTVGDNIAIRMLSAVFPSAGLDLSASEDPLVTSIGKALNSEPGPIKVVGHTDNVPVGAKSALGDNMTISVARARSAAQMLERHIDDPARVSFEGRGETDPIAPNDSADGRARNRRVEFQIPAERSP